MDNIKRLIDLSIKYRGEILHKCIILENKISENVTLFFVGDPTQYAAMMEIVIDRMTFDSKIATLSDVLKYKYGEIDNFFTKSFFLN